MVLNDKKRILIVSQTFPPFSGIGGRRWAKMAKYMDRKGMLVSVLSARLKHRNSSWKKDTPHVPHQTYRHRFPEVIEIGPKSFLDKISYRLWLTFLKLKSKGSPYDRALLDRKSFTAKFEKCLFEYKPDAVIVSGAPFRLLQFVIPFIRRNSQIKFIADFRDPWSWGDSYGYSNLNHKRKKFELSLEKKALSSFHLVTTPWPEIVSKLQTIHPEQADKIKLLPHGYDSDDFQDKSNDNKKGKKRIVFGGTIYRGMESTIHKIIKEVSQNKHGFELSLFSNDLTSTSTSNKIHISQPLPVNQFFAQIRNSTAVILLIPEHMKNGIPSKLYEYAYVGTPIVMLGKRGPTSNFIEENGFGVFVDNPENLFDSIINLPLLEPKHEELDNHSIQNITERFLNQINTSFIE